MASSFTNKASIRVLYTCIGWPMDWAMADGAIADGAVDRMDRASTRAPDVKGAAMKPAYGDHQALPVSET